MFTLHVFLLQNTLFCSNDLANIFSMLQGCVFFDNLNSVFGENSWVLELSSKGLDFVF